MWPFSKKENKTIVYLEDLTTCSACGCLLIKNRHTKGKPEVEEFSYLLSMFSTTRGKDYRLKENYYCKAHHPDNEPPIPF